MPLPVICHECQFTESHYPADWPCPSCGHELEPNPVSCDLLQLDDLEQAEVVVRMLSTACRQRFLFNYKEPIGDIQLGMATIISFIVDEANRIKDELDRRRQAIEIDDDPFDNEWDRTYFARSKETP